MIERTIRELTTQRNNALHYDNDSGAEMITTYHAIIGATKLHESSA